MSVRKNEQSTSSFNTLDAVLKLVSHTCNILSNDKVFIALVDNQKIKHSKKKINRMINLVDKGERTKHDVDVYFKCWKASLRFGNTHKLIENLNKWYLEQWKGAD